MSDRKKEWLLKGSIVVAASFGLLFVPVIPIIACILGKDFEEWKTIWIIAFVLFVITGVVMMVFMAVFKFDSKPIKAEKIALQFDDLNSLANHITDSTKSNNYAQQPTLSFANDGTLTTYVKPSGLWEVDCIALARVAELTDAVLDSANDAIMKSLKGYYGKERITDTVNMITIVCVDRVTPAFQKFVNSNVQQGFKNGRLPVGVSFGGKTIYIAKQKGGYAIAKYKRLRNAFLKIMEVQP